MPKHPALELLERTRRQTLALVDGLTQEQSEHRPASGRWSAGEVLHHLLRVDRLLTPAYRQLFARWRQRRRPVFLYRGLADFGIRLPLVPRPAQVLFLELPLVVAGGLVPTSVRRAVTRPRWVPTKAPAQIVPSFGEPVEDLLRELAEQPRVVGELIEDDPAVKLEQLRYFNPLVGYTDLPGLLRFTASHEERHQAQLVEILEDVHLPAAG